MAVNNIIKRIQNIMRSDAGINGDAQRIEQMTWMFFLKVYDTQEETWEYKAYKEKKEYVSIIPEPLRWRNWAIDEKDGKAMTGDELLSFVNNALFPVLKGNDIVYKNEDIKGIRVDAFTPRSKSVVSETFADLNQYMKNGTLLRQVVNIINEIEFDDADDRHTFGDIYEGILKDLQSAGNAGEFYTPRALTDFIVKMLDPKLGETFGDFTSGTGGFLTSALNYLAPQVKSASDNGKLQNAVVGQEWKPLPYLLSITNLLLHDIESPNIRHCDSLGTNVSDFKESDKVDVIGMNPPYGGSTGTSVQSNFPSAYRSSETADLFIALIMYRLKAGGRCGVIIPDGFLFGTDGAKKSIKENLLRKFNLHTIIRLPGSIFSPYTSINTNILFFNNEKADGATEGFNTKDVWFYRLDMPEGYKHFSKTKPMKLEHTQPIQDWWTDRREIVGDEIGEKSRVFSAQQLLDLDCNFDQCKFPKEDEEILPPAELFASFHTKCDKYLHDIYGVMNNLRSIIEGNQKECITYDVTSFVKFSELIKNTIENFKKSVLQEAIMGKLVPQDPTEGTAEELLAEIRKEKEKLVKEGKLKKKDLEVKPIEDDEIPFEIPEGWRWCRLGEIGSWGTGATPAKGKPEYYTNGDIPWLRTGELNNGYVYDSEIKVTQAALDNCSLRMCKKGDVLIAMYGATIGKVAIAGIELTTNQACCACTPVLVFNEYLMWYLMASKQAFIDLGEGGAQPNISREKIVAFPFALPPLAEQKRIVEKVEEVMREIEGVKK